METRDSFERLATGLTAEERQNILAQMRPSDSQPTAPLRPVDEKLDDVSEPLDVKLKREPFFLRLFIWIKAVFSSTTPTVIYNEHRLSEIAHYIQKNFPGLINQKQSLILSPFYERLTELKTCADFFRPYIFSLDDDDGMFYVFLSSFIMGEVTEDIKTNTDPYSNPVTPVIKQELRGSLLRKLDDIFEAIPADSKAQMYGAAKATEWMKQFVRLPFARLVTQFSSSDGRDTSCPFGQMESEIDTFARILCSSLVIPDEFLESLYMFALRNSRHANEGDMGRDAGEFLEKAHSNMGALQVFMTSIPVRSLGCLINNDSQWRAGEFSGGEDWFVKYKNTWKKMFEQKWAAWEADCKKEALLSTLKINFDIDSFPEFPQRPWQDLWNGVPFAYESTLGFLNWFMREKFSVCELDLKTLLVQGSFVKKENYNLLSESFNAMVQLSISFQELERRLSAHGETGVLFKKFHEERSRTLQAQTKVEQIMRSLESDVSSLIHRFSDNARAIVQVLTGALGLSKDARFDTVSNLNKLKDKNNEPFFKKIEESKATIENALTFVAELEQLDQQTKK